MSPFQVGEDIRQQIGGRGAAGADEQAARDLAPQAGEFLQGAVEVVEDPVRAGDEARAFRRRPGGFADPFDQGNAGFLLQLADLGADGGLGKQQVVRRF